MKQDISMMMLGTLILNEKTGKIEKIDSLAYPRPPEHSGKINDNPLSDYRHLPITTSLLAALGWKIVEDEIPNVIFATPPNNPLSNSKLAGIEVEPALDLQPVLEVRFILEDDAFEDWPKGWIIATNPDGEFESIDYFSDLELQYLKTYSRRMSIKFNTNSIESPTTAPEFTTALHGSPRYNSLYPCHK